LQRQGALTSFSGLSYHVPEKNRPVRERVSERTVGEEEGQMAQLPNLHRPGPLERLSPREREILPLVAAGKDNREIGQLLFISEKTAKNYVTSIRKKLELKN